MVDVWYIDNNHKNDKKKYNKDFSRTICLNSSFCSLEKFIRRLSSASLALFHLHLDTFVFDTQSKWCSL